MPVNRIQRDATANALAEFMRGEIGRPILLHKLESIGQAAGMLPDGDDLQKDVDLYLQEVLFIRAPRACQRIVQKDHWEELKRHLVFLKTDMCLQSQAALHDRQIILARCFLVAGMIVGVLSCWLGGSFLLMAWIIVPSVFFLIDPLHASLCLKLNEITIVDTARFYPFANRRDWLTHQHLLDAFGLPQIQVRAVADSPPKSLLERCLILAIHIAIVILAVAFTVLFAGVHLFLAWPCWLVTTAFERRPHIDHRPDS